MARFLVFFFLVVLLNANLIIVTMAELALPRKLGNHNDHEDNAGVSSEARAPESSSAVEVSASDEAGAGAPEQVMPIVHLHHKRPFDKSVCGGGVILGGLVFVFLLSIFCYIRATRRSKSVVEPESPMSSSYTGRKKAEAELSCSPSNVLLTSHVKK